MLMPKTHGEVMGMVRAASVWTPSGYWTRVAVVIARSGSPTIQRASVDLRVSGEGSMIEEQLLERIQVNPEIFGGKPIIRGLRIAVEHVLGMLAAGDTPEAILEGVPSP